jgi:hypothetical protein
LAGKVLADQNYIWIEIVLFEFNNAVYLSVRTEFFFELLRRMSEPVGEEGAEGWKALHNDGL